MVDGNQDRGIDRRRVLQTLGTTAAAGLAGCMGGGDGGDGGGGTTTSGGGGGDGGGGNLGERVPTIPLEYWSNLGGTTAIMEGAAPIIQKSVQERLGVKMEVKPVEFTTQINNTIQDKRTHYLGFWYHTSTPDRLDPHEMTRRYSADWAGGNGQANPPNWANCDYTHWAIKQAEATSDKQRQERVTNAHSIMSEELATLPLFPTVLYGAIRTDMVNLKGVGNAGVTRTNPYFYIKSEPKGDRSQLVAADVPVAMETSNYPIIDSSAAQAIWNHLVHSTLTEYNENHEIVNVLAEDYTVEDEGRKVTVTLKDATFHNGDPITSEDVKFTYEQLANHPGVYPQASSPPYESIKTLDEKTTEFNFKEPFIPLVSKVWPRWGIMHKKTWVEGGAPENAEEFEMDKIIGSGPFAVRNFEVGSHLDLTPHDGHPVHNPSYDLFLQAFRNQQTVLQAFQSGEVQLAPNLSAGITQRIRENMGENAETKATPGFMPFIIYPQWSWGPTMFREFRAAVSESLDRRQMNEVAMYGDSEPQVYSCPLQPAHPFRPDNENLTKQASQPQGSKDKARQILSDAGWGWDNNGNLRYPTDKDLSPRWPKNETPPTDEFTCLTAENNYDESYKPS